MITTGIVYIAVGDIDYLDMALLSAGTIEGNNPIIIYTDLDRDRQINNLIQVKNINPINNIFDSRYLKTKLPELSPFDLSLYLDCDIIANKNIDNIWEYDPLAMGLAYYPIVGDCHHIDEVEKLLTISEIGSAANHYNSGVILFDKSNHSVDLFNRWNIEWLRFKQQDQLALARAIYSLGAKITMLEQKWNCTPDRLESGTKFIHYSGTFKHLFWERNRCQ